MRKDKEWLKENLSKELYGAEIGGLFKDGGLSNILYADIINLIDQLEEPEITEKQAWDKISESYPANAASLAVSFEHFYYDEFNGNDNKPVIPQFVAEWIEKVRNHYTLGASLVDAGRNKIGNSDIESYIIHNEEAFVYAWYGNCEVEKEKRYIVKLGNVYLLEEPFSYTLVESKAHVFSMKSRADCLALEIGGKVEEVTK